LVVRQKSESAATPAKVFARPRSKPAKAHGGGVSPKLFYGLFTLLFTTNALTLVGFLMAPDISRLMNGQNEIVFGAYEDRIAQLRVEVDRLQSRHYAQAGDINLQLQELTQQQEVLLEQHQYVKQLAEKAAELGIETADLAPEAGDEDAPLITGSVERPSDIGAVADSVKSMMNESRLALAAISQEATKSTDEIVTALQGIGIRPKMPDFAEEGVGGPFIPASDGPEAGSLVDDANAVYEALSRFKAARGAIDLAPIHRPLGVATRTSSGFGNRTDPFTRGKAFHAGLDFPAPTGTTVLSAGYGKVTFAGQKSGYGNLVEVTHGAGLVTRYGHLSAFLVKEGQTVNTGSPIAKVGSTGRSTGPHLHFEVRRKDSPVDPSSYLAAGKRLQRYLGA
jgi:murein DD-endopeptidase MepM/ murein hydrolase activator NlpD